MTTCQLVDGDHVVDVDPSLCTPASAGQMLVAFYVIMAVVAAAILIGFAIGLLDSRAPMWLRYATASITVGCAGLLIASVAFGAVRR